MITIYPDEFNLREDGSYRQLVAIRGETGPAGPQGERGYGIGSAEFVPQVSLSEVQPTVVNNTVWIKLLSTDTGYALGNVLCGYTDALPTTRWDGTSLQKGDVYIMMGASNQHPVTWGSMTFSPYKCWLRSNSTWVYKDAEVYVQNQWWPLNAEWLVENGNIVGASAIPTEGTSKFSVSKNGDYLVLTGGTTVSSSTIYITCTFGNETTSACTYCMIGEIVTNSIYGRYGALETTEVGTGTSRRSFAISNAVPINTTQTDPSIVASSYSPGKTFGLELGVKKDYGSPVVRIKHLYRVFNS